MSRRQVVTVLELASRTKPPERQRPVLRATLAEQALHRQMVRRERAEGRAIRSRCLPE